MNYNPTINDNDNNVIIETNMSDYLAYISDLDGTLCDTISANIAAYRDAFKDAGLIFDEDAYRKGFGLRYDKMIKLIAPDATDIQISKIAERKQFHYANHMDLVAPNKALIRLLHDLKGKGSKIALTTTAKRRNALSVLEYLGLSHFFDAVISGEDVQKGKPNPECYIKAADMLGVSENMCLVFEDSEIGIMAAANAGMSYLKVSI